MKRRRWHSGGRKIPRCASPRTWSETARRRPSSLRATPERSWPPRCSSWGAWAGVDRPALPAVVPNRKGGVTVWLDVGANVDSKPQHIHQWAIMAHIYAKNILGVASPRVGLLSIGEEAGKGNDLVKETFKLLQESRINFIGNVEGHDIFDGSADVIVCDGFTGNVSLKAAEGAAEARV